jgi:hypothetical protein
LKILQEAMRSCDCYRGEPSGELDEQTIVWLDLYETEIVADQINPPLSVELLGALLESICAGFEMAAAENVNKELAEKTSEKPYKESEKEKGFIPDQEERVELLERLEETLQNTVNEDEKEKIKEIIEIVKWEGPDWRQKLQEVMEGTGLQAAERGGAESGWRVPPPEEYPEPVGPITTALGGPIENIDPLMRLVGAIVSLGERIETRQETTATAFGGGVVAEIGAGVLNTILTLGDVLGVTGLAEGIVGADTATGRRLSEAERFKRISDAGIQIGSMLATAGFAKEYKAIREWRGAEPIVVVKKATGVHGPGTPHGDALMREAREMAKSGNWKKIIINEKVNKILRGEYGDIGKKVPDISAAHRGTGRYAFREIARTQSYEAALNKIKPRISEVGTKNNSFCPAKR